MSDASFEHFKAQLDPIFEAGGTVSSVNLDGVIYRTVKGLCKHTGALDLKGVAEETVAFFALVRNRYPNMKIGLTPNLPNWDYTAELHGFSGFATDLTSYTWFEALDAISSALTVAGDKIDYLEVDCPYTYYRQDSTRNGDKALDNKKKFLSIQSWCVANNVEFRMMINTEQNGELREDEFGNQAFHDLVLEYIRRMRVDGIFPDGFIIQSWYNNPDKNLPETENGTFTNTLRDVVRLIHELYPHDSEQYTRSDYQRAWSTGMGVERVAKIHSLPVYRSKPAESDNTTRWVQIDLGQVRIIDEIKMLPYTYHPSLGLESLGFPVRFKIELCEEETFSHPVLIYDHTDGDYPSPKDNICTIQGNQKKARFVRLTATKLNQKVLSLAKMEIYSGGLDVAEGRPVTDSESGYLGQNALTRAPRPQGERVVSNHPENVIPSIEWNPQPYIAVPPKGGVELGEGIFKATMDNNVGYLLNHFSVDLNVRHFRIKSGIPVDSLPAKMHDNGWFNCLPGSSAGRFLMGAGNTLRWEDNKQLRKKMNDIIDVIDECTTPDGYMMGYPEDKIFYMEYGAYVRSWLTHGLIEAGYAGNTKAFSLLRNYYDWFNDSPYLPELLRRSNQGTQGVIPMTRMYFTPVGKTEDIYVTQKYFQENYWMEQLAKREAKAIYLYPYDRPHNYLVTGIEPYLDLYRATGAPKYLEAAEGAWDLFHDNWIHVGGSFAITEDINPFPPKSYYLHRGSGELCGSVFWVEFNQRLHSLFPKKEKYVTEIEKSIYNVAIANQVGTNGIRYHAKLTGHKETDSNPYFYCLNTCCEGQGTRLFGSLPEYIYSVAKDGLYVNLFSNSAINFDVKGNAVQIEMFTEFPFQNNVALEVSTRAMVDASIRIRVPSWASKNVEIMVNGKTLEEGKPGSFVAIDRLWKNGDKITFTLPMDFKIRKYIGADRDPAHERYFLEYGPVLMALVGMENAEGEAILALNPENISNTLTAVAGNPLHFNVKSNPRFTYIPYWEVKDEAFTCVPEVIIP